MKADKKFFKRCIVGALWLLMVLGFAPRLQAQDDGWKPLMEINGFGYDEDSAGTYWFYPVCDGNFCTGLQERNYTYIWDFGRGRYSLEAAPRVRFDSDVPTKVTLRVKGIKQIKDPDGARQIRPALNNCAVTDSFVGQVELGRTTVERPRIEPTARILQPSHPPVPGKCADYIVQWDFAKECRHRGDFVLRGSILGDSLQSWGSILGYEPSPGITVEAIDSTGLRIKIDNTQNATLQLLLHCKFSGTVQIEELLHWELTGRFNGSRTNQGCGAVAVNLVHEDRFGGSLDPSYLASGAPGLVSNGEKILWDVRLRNDGNAPEHHIELVDTLPAEFDWESVEFHAALWAGKDIVPIIEKDTVSRRIKWILNNDAAPLQPGEYAQLQFYVRVDTSFPCPEGYVGDDCKHGPTVGLRVHHHVWTKFHGEQIEGHSERRHLLTSDETVVLCDHSCAPTPNAAQPIGTKNAWVPITLTIVIAGAVVLYLLYLLIKAKRKPSPVV